MARLISLGETVTRGEAKTLKYLQENLPSDWVVLGNVQVTNGDRNREIDAVVVGSRGVWVIDEKGMGGTISGDAHTWVLASGHARERVMDGIEMAAKALKGKLTSLRSDLPGNLWVESLVILSADDVDYKRIRDARIDDHVRKLQGSENYFLQAPSRATALSAKQRDAIAECIAGGRVANRLRRRFSEIGPYSLAERLREEPYGATYLAHHRETKEEVELKIYDLSALPSGLSREVVLRRAQREFEALRQLRDQRGIVRVVESFQEVPGFGDDLFYLALDLPKGPTLASRLADADWTVDERLSFAQRLIDVVAGVHRRGIIHRNLSPAQVYFENDGALRLSGFELSRVEVMESLHLSNSDYLTGPYMAPELCERERPTTASSDLYALGVMIYETLTGLRPFGNRSRRSGDVEPSLSSLAGQLAPSALSHIEAVLQLMLAFKPDDRFQSGEQIIELAFKPETTQVVLAKRAINEGHPMPAGTTLGEFRVLSHLGAGGCFHAYAVEAPSDGQKFVAKVLRYPELLLVNVIKQEFNALSAVHHPNVVEVFEARHRADAPYHMLLSYVDGDKLFDVMESGPVPVARAIRWGQQLAGALAYLESNSPRISHGDISPSNIIIQDDCPCLIDFGLAHIGGQGVSDRVTGTMNYRPPERDVPGAPWPEAGDTYSLAVILCELLLGELPFTQDGSGYPNKDQVKENLFIGRAGVSAELLRVLRRAVSPEATQRYGSATTFQAALEATPELTGDVIDANHESSSALPGTLEELLALPTREAYLAVARMLSERHTFASYRRDQQNWYTEKKRERVWEAIEAKKQGRYSASLAIYGEVFLENPTWHGLYNSAYKVLMPSGRVKEALAAIHIYGLLLALDFASRGDVLVHDRKFLLETPYHALMLWPMQDHGAFLVHLGAATMASCNDLKGDLLTRYVNTIAGRDGVLGVEADPMFMERGKKALLELPWAALALCDTENSIVRDLLVKVRKDFRLGGSEIAVTPDDEDPIDFFEALNRHWARSSTAAGRGHPVAGDDSDSAHMEGPPATPTQTVHVAPERLNGLLRFDDNCPARTIADLIVSRHGTSAFPTYLSGRHADLATEFKAAREVRGVRGLALAKDLVRELPDSPESHWLYALALAADGKRAGATVAASYALVAAALAYGSRKPAVTSSMVSPKQYIKNFTGFRRIAFYALQQKELMVEVGAALLLADHRWYGRYPERRDSREDCYKKAAQLLSSLNWDQLKKVPDPNGFLSDLTSGIDAAQRATGQFGGLEAEASFMSAAKPVSRNVQHPQSHSGPPAAPQGADAGPAERVVPQASGRLGAWSTAEQVSNSEIQGLVALERKLEGKLSFRDGRPRPSQQRWGFLCHLEALQLKMEGYTRKALARWQEGAAYGSEVCMHMAGTLQYSVFDRRQEAVSLWRQAAALGSLSAKYMLVFALEQDGTPFPNATLAFRHHKQESQREPKSQIAISLAYSYGLGVDFDDEHAAEALKAAAILGDPDAQCMLGQAYLEGDGLPCSGKEAKYWFEKAVAQSHMESTYRLGELLCDAKMPDYSPDLEAVRRGIELLTLAANGGEVEAQNRLGMEYQFGILIEEDIDQARKWYQVAAECGSDDALREFDKMLALQL